MSAWELYDSLSPTLILELFPGILLLRTSAICSGSKRVIVPLSIVYAVRPRPVRWECLRLTVYPGSNSGWDCNYLALPPHNAL